MKSIMQMFSCETRKFVLHHKATSSSFSSSSNPLVGLKVLN